ncbi:MAG: hypothetical protein J2P13_08725 [Acidobacteria bacterium]|nr:hypothetical protein [Acidobacteriota bacterium]
MIALVSLASAKVMAGAERPRYGGSLRIAIEETPPALDPAARNSAALRSLNRLVFENLVRLDDRGRPQPSLAVSWQAEPGNQRWRFKLRGGVIFSDGTRLDAAAVAASVRAGNPGWKVFAMGDQVMIESAAPERNLAAELALPRNSIVRRDNGRWSGTGPFTLANFDAAAKHFTLAANERYWAGRPFLDSIEVDLGKSYRDQMMLLDLGKSDLVELAPGEIHPAQADNRRVASSLPEELMCLVFSREAQSDAETHERNALARSIDSSALANVVFQGGGEATGALLPNWLSGYGFVFAPAATGGGGGKAPGGRAPWTLAYDPSDPAAHLVADRIQLKARDAGITLKTVTSGNADLRLVRVSLPSLAPRLALSELARELELPLPGFDSPSIGSLYSAENALLKTRRAIPLVHLRTAIALRPTVRAATVGADGGWELENTWLQAERP